MADIGLKDKPNPLLEALPPATDYLTYLTLLEYNLKTEDLPLLNDILQDATLTINIGWDLIFLLVPLLPASERCLQTIARLGNSREVLLKVTEALRCIDFTPPETVEDAVATSQANTRADAPSNETQHVDENIGVDSNQTNSNRDLPVLHFKVLLSMLSVLHRRIKTKYPSRFIATTVQGVLAAFSNAQSGHEELLLAVYSFVQKVLRSRRPDLPPRDSQEKVSTQDEETQSADPEAQPEPTSQEEHQITRRLLQGLLSHVMEAYLIALAADRDVTGLAWSSRIFEIMQPGMIVPGRISMQLRFTTEEKLLQRESSVTKMADLALELGLTSSDLLTAIFETDRSDSRTAGAEEDPPDSAEDIPLSKTGSLFIFDSKIMGGLLDPSKARASQTPNLFPTLLQITQSFIGAEEAGGLNTAGSEPSSLIDIILALGLAALYQGNIGEPESDEQFSQYLQIITLISANSPEPNLRFHAYFFASSLLRAHPSDVYRLSFIRDTLEHCPIENLKASAVSWVKGETLEANIASTGPKEDNEPSIFATPVALQSLAPFLFPNIRQIFSSSDLVEKWTLFRMNYSFYLAVLNFFYLLISAPQLQEPLWIAALAADNSIEESMLGPLHEFSSAFRESLNDGVLAEVEGNAGASGGLSDLDILDDVLERIARRGYQKQKP